MMITVIHALILLWCVRQMRMIQSGIEVTVLIHALILLWCVRQMRMVQSGINNDSGHSYIDISRGVYVKCVWFAVE